MIVKEKKGEQFLELIKKAWWNGRNFAHDTKTKKHDEFDLQEFLKEYKDEINSWELFIRNV